MLLNQNAAEALVRLLPRPLQQTSDRPFVSTFCITGYTTCGTQDVFHPLCEIVNASTVAMRTGNMIRRHYRCILPLQSRLLCIANGTLVILTGRI